MTSNTKPTPNPVPTEAQPASTSIVPTITAVNVPDHTPLSKQNGIKNEESEDLFSPLREGLYISVSRANKKQIEGRYFLPNAVTKKKFFVWFSTTI